MIKINELDQAAAKNVDQSDLPTLMFQYFRNKFLYFLIWKITNALFDVDINDWFFILLMGKVLLKVSEV